MEAVRAARDGAGLAVEPPVLPFESRSLPSVTTHRELLLLIAIWAPRVGIETEARALFGTLAPSDAAAALARSVLDARARHPVTAP